MERNDANDPYYRRYKLVSTAYRLCAFFSWLELYRREVTFLDSGRSATNARLDAVLEKIRSDLADGHLNGADDWLDWKDALIFREELRAIGETMISVDGRVQGYSTFTRQFDEDRASLDRRWSKVAADFLFDLAATSAQKDFRTVRCLRLLWHLMELIELCDAKRLPRDVEQFRVKVSGDLRGYEMDAPL